MNSLCRYWNAAILLGTSNNAIKCYERGSDADKKWGSDGRPYWDHKTVDRVRLEFTLTNKRDRRRLVDCGVRFLSGFVCDPRMFNALLGKFRFAVFAGSHQLPSEGMDYLGVDGQSETQECFQQEYLLAREKGINPSQYIEDSRLMAPLMFRVQEALRQHGEDWQARHEDLTKDDWC